MTRCATDSETVTAPGSRERSNQAIVAFVAAKADIDAMLERLQALSADHFDALPDQINWAHVGTLGNTRASLRAITDGAFKEGEYAD